MSTVTKPLDAVTEAIPVPVPEAESGRPKWTRTQKVARFVRTTVVVLALLAAAVAGGNHLVRQRIAERAYVPGTAVLTADPIEVGSADGGVVTRTLVDEKAAVTAGELLARVRLSGGGPATDQDVRAPAAGVVTEILTPGAVARAGEPVATMYDPAKLVFAVDMPLQTLRRLRLGMRAEVTGPGLTGRVTATLASVKPKVDDANGRLTVVLRPDAAALATVRTLVPGLQFAVVVDTNTAPGGTPAVNSA
jgi:multidrug resistance efflux pump